LCDIGGVLRSNLVTDFLKLRIGRPHFRVHYPCKLFVLFWYFGYLTGIIGEGRITVIFVWFLWNCSIFLVGISKVEKIEHCAVYVAN